MVKELHIRESGMMPSSRESRCVWLTPVGKTDRQIERDLGLYQGAILRWRDELEADPIDAFPGTGHQKPLEEEVRRLLRELDIAREERDILKKVVAIFSKTPKADSGS